MKFSSIYSICIVLLVMINQGCSEKQEASNEYKIINTVLDSIVKKSSKHHIGFNLVPLNQNLSEELIHNPGFKFYENGKFFNKCPENNINSSTFSNFNYKAFSSTQTLFDSLKITNQSITTSFQISEKSQKRLKEILSEVPSSDKKDWQYYLWENEHRQRIFKLSTPIFSNDYKTAVVYVHARDYGIQSWTLQYSESRSWSIFCLEQITIE